MPTRYRDLETVAMFMAAVLKGWRQSMPASAPTSRRLDKFLMMYGKALKPSAPGISHTLRRLARAGIANALAEGVEAVRDLEVAVVVETHSDPTRVAARERAC